MALRLGEGSKLGTTIPRHLLTRARQQVLQPTKRANTHEVSDQPTPATPHTRCTDTYHALRGCIFLFPVPSAEMVSNQLPRV